MTDEQYAEYLSRQEDLPTPARSLEDRMGKAEADIRDLQHAAIQNQEVKNVRNL